MSEGQRGNGPAKNPKSILLVNQPANQLTNQLTTRPLTQVDGLPVASGAVARRLRRH